MKKRNFTYIYEPKLDGLLKRNFDLVRLDFTTDYKNSHKDIGVVFIGTRTLEREDGLANLDCVFNVCKRIAENNIDKNCLVVVK